MASELVQLREERDAKGKALFDLWQEAGPERDVTKIKTLDGDNSAKFAELKHRREELDAIGVKIEELAAVETEADAGMAYVPGTNRKSAGTAIGPDRTDMAEARPVSANVKALLGESAGLKALREGGLKGHHVLFEIEDPDSAESFLQGVKATIALTDMAPLSARQPTIVPSAQNRIVVSDLMAPGTTDSNTVSYFEEPTFTNAAAETAEATAKPEGTLDFTERTDTVRKIATWIPITDEALNDNAQLRSYVEGRLVYMVRQREEQQLITGNGTPPNIQGILNRSGIQTQAKGADPTPDAFFKAFTKVAVTGDADPDGFVIHPNDWQDVRLLRTADGIYIFGNPNDDIPVRMWGYPGRVTTGITENTGLVGAFRTYSQVFRREGLRVIASTEHASFFVENKVALLAETRLALAVYRPAAFASVTGI